MIPVILKYRKPLFSRWIACFLRLLFKVPFRGFRGKSAIRNSQSEIERISLVPEKFSDLSPVQFLAYIHIVFLRINDLFIPIEGKGDVRYTHRDAKEMVKVRIRLLYHLLGVEYKLWNKLDPEQILAMLYLTDFLFKKETISKNYIRSYSISPSAKLSSWKDIELKSPSGDLGVNLLGPEHLLIDTCIAELGFADKYYRSYKKNASEADLNQFIGIFYRPAENGKRVEFNNDNADLYLDIIAKWPIEVKTAIILWYEACISMFPKQFPNVYSSNNESKAKDKGWLPVFLAMSGDKFGPYRDTLMTETSVFLSEMDNRIKEIAELKQKYKSR